MPETLFATTFAVRSRRHTPFLVRVLSAVFAAGLWFSAVRVEGAEGASATTRLKVAVVQMAFAPTLEGNRDRIVSGVADAAARGARVAVFPEGALNARAGDSSKAVKESIAAVSRAAATHRIYVILGGVNHSPALKKMVNWMRVFGPDGAEIFHYDKLYNHPRGAMPGVFSIDGVPCSGMICADRWLRGVEEIPIQQGAQISFELSNNFACEWVGPLGWYWNVPRALRNNVWVVVANTGNRVAGVADESPEGPVVRHGHSAIVAPDGRIVTGADETATIIMAEIDPSRATREEAIARATHPVLREFWQAGLKLQQGEKLPAPQLAPLPLPETEVTLAVSQVSGDVTKMVRAIRDARERTADLVAFPARAVAHTALEELQAAAREHAIVVVFGAEYPGTAGVPAAASGEDQASSASNPGARDPFAPGDGGRDTRGPRNSAFVIGPDGTLLTRYDQLSAKPPYRSGMAGSPMWFRVKGVPAFVTIGRDALWTELTELAVVAGAQVHVHLDDDPDASPAATLRRRQIWSNAASYLTFTAVANVVDSTIWDDLSGMAESRHIVRGTPKPDHGPVEVDSPFSANLVISTTPERPLVVATRRVAATNPHFKRRTLGFNPQMEPWYQIGATIIQR